MLGTVPAFALSEVMCEQVLSTVLTALAQADSSMDRPGAPRQTTHLRCIEIAPKAHLGPIAASGSVAFAID